MWQKILSWMTRDTSELKSVETLPSDPSVQIAIANVVLSDIIKERRHDRTWKLLKRTGYAAVFCMGLVYYISFHLSINGLRLIPDEPLVGVIRIEGSIMNTSIASAEKVMPALKRAFETENVKAIILSIDSPGGAPVEAERINYVIDEMKAKHKKPVYAVIQNVGASAGYMIALHADKIYAGRYSMVGSIGAVMSTWDVHKALAKVDVYQKVYASGELKAMLNPFIPSTPAAEEKAQQIVNLMGKKFADELHQLRGQYLLNEVKYDTGEIWDGEEARKIGLIDELGTIESIVDQFPGAKLYEFGPKNANNSLFGGTTSISDWIKSMMTESFRNAITTTMEPTIN